MAQKHIPGGASAAVAKKGFENVSESWVMYDTVLVAKDLSLIATYRDGYFATFAAVGQASAIPFFNVRNRTHGLAYNNQDTRDQLPYVMKIYSVGVSFFSPSTTTFTVSSAGAQRTSSDCWESEVPKHTSLTLQTNQDERLKINSLLAPPGYGVQVSGVAQGDVETSFSYPNIQKINWCQGMPELTNKWAFRKPLLVPRRANLSVTLNMEQYIREMMAVMPGPYYQRFLGNDQMATVLPAVYGIQVTIGGIREVQQRGQYHA